jgi:hypothetical protein
MSLWCIRIRIQSDPRHLPDSDRDRHRRHADPEKFQDNEKVDKVDFFPEIYDTVIRIGIKTIPIHNTGEYNTGK